MVRARARDMSTLRHPVCGSEVVSVAGVLLLLPPRAIERNTDAIRRGWASKSSTQFSRSTCKAKAS